MGVFATDCGGGGGQSSVVRTSIRAIARTRNLYATGIFPFGGKTGMFLRHSANIALNYPTGSRSRLNVAYALQSNLVESAPETFANRTSFVRHQRSPSLSLSSCLCRLEIVRQGADASGDKNLAGRVRERMRVMAAEAAMLDSERLGDISALVAEV